MNHTAHSPIAHCLPGISGRISSSLMASPILDFFRSSALHRQAR